MSFATNRRVWAIAALVLATLIFVEAKHRFWDAPKLNVILVTFDTTRADHLGSYGYQHGLTAGFDDFARGGVIFERAYAPTPITLPSHATMLTGLYPPEHGLRANGESRLAKQIPLLPEILKQHGYDTAAFIAAVVLDSQYGLARGFETYDDDLSNKTTDSRFGERRRDGQEIVDSALSWLGRRGSRPFFCWIHLYDAHGLYNMRPELFGNRFEQNPYDAGVAVEVQQFDRLIRYLKERGLTKNTLIVVAGDHGEGLDDHTECEHGMLVYNTTLHVPFVFAGPRDCQPGHHVSNAVSLVDLMPTVLDLLKIRAPRHLSGRSLVTALKGEEIASTMCYGEAQAPYMLNRWCPLHTLISDRWKYIQTTRPELYDLQTDPEELSNLADSETNQCQQMRNALEIMRETFVQSNAPNVNLSEKDQANLRSLGYVAGGNKVPDARPSAAEDFPDIKDMLPLLAKYEKAKHFVFQGQIEDAIALTQEIIHSRNDYTAALVLLAECLVQANRPNEAIDAYHAAIKQRPDFTKARLMLARLLASQNCFEQATTELREAIQHDPESALLVYELAEILAAMNQHEEAILKYREAIRIDPESALANLHLGHLLVKLQRPKDAISCFEQANRLDPRNSSVQSSLLQVYMQTGEETQAFTLARKSVELDPKSFTARLNLGNVFISKNDYRKGIAEYREAQKLRPGDPRPVEQIKMVEAALKKSGK